MTTWLYVCVWRYISSGLEVNREKAFIFQEDCDKFNVFFYQFEWSSTYLGIDFFELSAASQKSFLKGGLWNNMELCNLNVSYVQATRTIKAYRGNMAFISTWALLGVADKMMRSSEQLGVFSRSHLDYEQKNKWGWLKSWLWELEPWPQSHLFHPWISVGEISCLLAS